MKKRYFLDSVAVELTPDEASQYNVVVTKSNGYSHIWNEIEKFDPKKHINQIHLTTKPINQFVMGSSQVSFS